MRFDGQLTLDAARQQYCARLGLPVGGYGDRWVRFSIGPNSKARVRAVKLHNLHHVLTEYDTTWTGEAEISACEIASGCGRYSIAWLINFGAFALGLLVALPAVYRAFLRGRRSGNLYGGKFEDGMLKKKVG